jgi:glycosyltransferase involved in cell wall biosynthesis
MSSLHEDCAIDIVVSVYVVSRNYGRYLTAAIESVLTQTYKNWELLLIDDGSIDNTSDIMNLYSSDPRIRIFNTGGIGLPGVCNTAILESKGKYIIRLDGDDILDENALLVLTHALEADSHLAFVFPDYYLIDINGLITSHERREKLVFRNHVPDMPPNGACTLIRKSILIEIGGYREDLGAQDGLDLWSKVRHQYSVKNINLPLFYYRRHQDNLTNTPHRILAARRYIKSESLNEETFRDQPIIAVIPCRKMYDFTENLWNLKLGNFSLLELLITKFLSSQFFQKIIITSDTDEVLDTIKKFNDDRLEFLYRAPSKTLRSVSVVETLKDVVNKYDPEATGILTLGYVASPFVTSGSIVESIATLIFNNADSSMGVDEISEPVYIRSEFGLSRVNADKVFNSDFNKAYKDANISLSVRSSIIKTGSLTGSKAISFMVDSKESFFIDTNSKFEIAQIINTKA